MQLTRRKSPNIPLFKLFYVLLFTSLCDRLSYTRRYSSISTTGLHQNSCDVIFIHINALCSTYIARYALIRGQSEFRRLRLSPGEKNRLLSRYGAEIFTIFVSIEKLRGNRSQYGSIAHYFREDGPRKRLSPRRRKQDPVSMKSETGERKRREVTSKICVPQECGGGQRMKKERPSKDDETIERDKRMKGRRRTKTGIGDEARG